MERRTFFSDLTAKILTGLGIGGVLNTFCMRVAHAADSAFRWPSYPSTEALRRHLATSPKHKGVGSVKGKSRAQLISMHDASHFRRGDKETLKKTTSIEAAPSSDSNVSFVSSSPEESTSEATGIILASSSERYDPNNKSKKYPNYMDYPKKRNSTKAAPKKEGFFAKLFKKRS